MSSSTVKLVCLLRLIVNVGRVVNRCILSLFPVSCIVCVNLTSHISNIWWSAKDALLSFYIDVNQFISFWSSFEVMFGSKILLYLNLIKFFYFRYLLIKILNDLFCLHIWTSKRFNLERTVKFRSVYLFWSLHHSNFG